MKIRIGIIGYGNLGKAVEREVLKHTSYKLVAIFSRRLVSSTFGTTIEPYENFFNFKNKIDIMLLCGGSKNDLEPQTQDIVNHFNCINTFDTHSKIAQHLQIVDKIAKDSRHLAVVSCGWDPGLFSVIRAIFFKFSNQEPFTFWGRGISMGHSDAIRQIQGVDDGIQFTIPNSEAVKLAKQNKLPPDMARHFRECFITTSSENTSQIEMEIKSIPNYFLGQPTTVKFVGNQQLLKLKSKMSHKGHIISQSHDGVCLEFKVKMKSNPAFTAKIMTAYIDAITHLKGQEIFGAFTPLDIPVSYLFKDRNDLIKKFC